MSTSDSPLPEWQVQSIDLFVRAANLIGLPPSVAQVYGLLYTTPEPLCLDDCRTRLGISKGGASQALQFLRRVNAVNPVFVPGDRRDFYQAELHLKKIVTGFLRDQIIPHLESGKARLEQIQDLATQNNPQNPDPIPPEIQKRLKRLEGWRKKANSLLPVVTKVLG